MEKPLDTLPDEELMLAYQQGNAAAFDILYGRHKGGLYRYFLRQLNHRPEIASELFQDIWMKLIHARHGYRVNAKFTTWLYRMAHNRLIDFWRSEKHKNLQQVYEDSVYSPAAEPEDKIQQQQNDRQIKQAIAELPEEQRSAFLLKEEGGLSLSDIAEITGVNRETVKSRLRYGVKRLRQRLQPLRSVT